MQIAERLYGRIKSRALTARQEKLFKTLLPEIRIREYPKIEHTKFEIGFGRGEYITNLALKNPDCLYVGSEPFINGIASLLVKIDEYVIRNIRIFPDDARKLLGTIPDNHVDEVHLMFPDPWPKRKHIERRFVNECNIKEIYRILTKTNGIWKIASDHEVYQAYILKMFENFQDLFKLTEMYNKNNRPSEEIWPKTRYEMKAVLGEALFLIYKKK
ncbi:MAG: hypothetical protein LBI26_02835 [Holosporales bacterium]|jgi:tRNA (guanine-N7-)-methyltransferase|nr:hypothetical protein [Holosporales bacterium]